MSSGRLSIGAACIAASLAATDVAAQEPIALRVEVEQPRAFGWRLGDTFERRITVEVPQGMRLDEASLPRIARPGTAAELRAIERTGERIAGGERLHLVLRYQLFVSPVEPRTYELQGFRMRFAGAAGSAMRDETALVEVWPIAAAPLAPAETSPRTGLGELRPDAKLPRAEPPFGRLAAWAALAVLLLGWLAHVYLGDRWWAKRQRPFARAYRELARLDLAAGANAPLLRDAFRRLHRAFDESAGRATFAADAASFAADGSRWAPLRAEIAAFFERSRAAFFDGTPAAADDGTKLLALARALRDTERGTA